MINQLRIYEIYDSSRDVFLDRFRDHAARIMTQYGFSIQAMWETRHNEKPAFAYLLVWRDTAHMQSAWEEFMADEEWKEVKRQTLPEDGRIVGEITDLVLEPAEFSTVIQGLGA